MIIGDKRYKLGKGNLVIVNSNYPNDAICAERLLLTTERNITDIAGSMEFYTTSYFIERFRSAYGTTPHMFRRRFTEVAKDATSNRKTAAQAAVF